MHSLSKMLVSSLLIFCCSIMAMEQDTWNAEEYENNSLPQYQDALSLLETVEFERNEDVLELGSGTGKIVKYLAQRVPQGGVIGIDSSKRMIEHCGKVRMPGNVAFELKKAEDTSYTDEIDSIVMVASMHWIKDQKKVLSNCAQALKLNGKLIIQMANDKENPMKKPFIATAMSERWKPVIDVANTKLPFHPGNVAGMKAMLEEAGFEVKQCEEVVRPRSFESQAKFTAWVKAWAGIILSSIPTRRGESLSSLEQDSFLADAIDKVPRRNDGTYGYDVSKLNVIAVKK